MIPTVPPRLVGPRMAVFARFPFDNRTLSDDGTRATWSWAMSQWDRVAQAGGAVRVVVADQIYSRLDEPSNAGVVAEAVERFVACRNAEQLVFGSVYAGGGKVPLGSLGQKFDDPLRPGRQVPSVADQIATWSRLFPGAIDGIYVDSGPTDCTDPSVPGSQPIIARNYADYVSTIRQLSYKVCLQTVQFPDNKAWLQVLGADVLELWNGGVAPYSTRFFPIDPCRPGATTTVPAWWDPGVGRRWNRLHVINDCRDVDTMRRVANLAINERGSTTISISRPRQDPTLGAVYDVLPVYWDDQVAFFQAFVRQEEKDAKDAKDGKDEPDGEKQQKDSKDQGDSKNEKDTKDGKDEKDNKEDIDAAQKVDKDNKDGKGAKDEPDSQKPEPEGETEKQAKDGKDFKEANDKQPEFLKDGPDSALKTLETIGMGLLPDSGADATDDGVLAIGRTFIRPDERPVVGERIVAEPADSAN